MSGFCAALPGTLLTSLIGGGTASVASAYLLPAFAATCLSSATLRDSVFHVLGAFIGVIIIEIEFTSLAILGIPTLPVRLSGLHPGAGRRLGQHGPPVDQTLILLAGILFVYRRGRRTIRRPRT